MSHSRLKMISYVTALFCGIAIAFVNSRSLDPGFPSALVMAASMILGIINPFRCWRWAVIIVTCMLVSDILHVLSVSTWLLHQFPIPSSFFYARLVTTSEYAADFLSDLPALAPALAAAYFGRWISELPQLYKTSTSADSLSGE